MMEISSKEVPFYQLSSDAISVIRTVQNENVLYN